MFGLLLLAAVAAAAGYVAYCYINAPAVITVSSLDPNNPVTRPSTTMDKLAYSTKKSATLFVAGAQAAVVMLGNAVVSMADFFQAPEVRMWITEHFSVEVGSTLAIVCLGLVCWARARNAMGV